MSLGVGLRLRYQMDAEPELVLKGLLTSAITSDKGSAEE
jgi:hypothetical protein